MNLKKTSVIPYLRMIFEGKYSSSIFLMTAIILKILLYLHFFKLEGDKLFQAIAGKNLAEGKGLTIQYVHASQITREIFTPLNRWPPGYSLLFGFFYSFTGNITASCLIIDILSIILFIGVLQKILKFLDFPLYLSNLILLFQGAFITIYLSQPTDLLALAVELSVLYASLIFISDNKKPAGYGWYLGLLNIIPFVLRYMYAPAALLTPLLFIWSGYIKKEKRLVRGGVYMFFITVISMASLLLFQKIYAGSATYVMPAEKGIFWSNLFTIAPAIFDSFVNLNFICLQLRRISTMDYQQWALLIRNIHTVVFLILLIPTIRFLIRQKFTSRSPWQFFILFGVLINMAVLALLAYLSVTRINRSPFQNDDSIWTFISDERYFVFIMVFFYILAAHFLFMRSWKKRLSVQKILQYVFVLLLIFEVGHTTYFIVNRFNPIGYAGKNVMFTIPAMQYLDKRVKEVKASHREPVFAGFHETVANKAVLLGAKGLLDGLELNSGGITTKENAVLFLILEKEEIPLFFSFFRENGVHLEKMIDGVFIYTYNIAANG